MPPRETTMRAYADQPIKLTNKASLPSKYLGNHLQIMSTARPKMIDYRSRIPYTTENFGDKQTVSYFQSPPQRGGKRKTRRRSVRRRKSLRRK